MTETATANPLLTAKEGDVFDAPSVMPKLTATEATKVTVIERAETVGGERIVVRLHWYGIFLGQKAGLIAKDTVRWQA